MDAQSEKEGVEEAMTERTAWRLTGLVWSCHYAYFTVIRRVCMVSTIPYRFFVFALYCFPDPVWTHYPSLMYR